MIFVHLRSYNQLKVKKKKKKRCRKIAVFAKNILCTFTPKTNYINHETHLFKRRKRYENNVFHTCEK